MHVNPLLENFLQPVASAFLRKQMDTLISNTRFEGGPNILNTFSPRKRLSKAPYIAGRMKQLFEDFIVIINVDGEKI